jgi:leukotriene-A4 hydrolase
MCNPEFGGRLGIGREKFVRSLFVELLIAVYQQELVDTYANARLGYHSSLQVQLDKLLNF